MSVWRIHHVKKWFIISLISLSIIWGIFITGLCFITTIKERYYLYMVILFGIYALASVYFLLKQCLFRFFPYIKKEGELVSAVITYSLSSTGENSSRPLAYYLTDGKKKTIALLGMFDHLSKKKLKEGQRVTIYKIKGEQLALLLDD